MNKCAKCGKKKKMIFMLILTSEDKKSVDLLYTWPYKKFHLHNKLDYIKPT